MFWYRNNVLNASFVCFCLLEAIVGTGLVIAQDSSAAQVALLKAKKFNEEAMYDSGFVHAEKALALFRSAEIPKGVGESLIELGLAEQFRKRFKSALAYYLKGAEILEVEMTDVELATSGLYNRLGGVSTDLGYRFKGRQYLEKAYRLCQLYGSEDSLATATVHYNLGLSSMYFGETQLALQHFMKALPVYFREFGEYGVRVAHLFHNVGILYKDIGEFDHAQEYLNRSIKIHKHNHGDNYWNLAYPYLALATTLDDGGQEELAMPYYSMTLKLCKENPEKLVRVESITYGSLAMYYRDKREFGKCLDYANRAIELIQKNYRNDHPRINDYYIVIGDAMRDQKDYASASAWYEKVIQNVNNEFGPHHPRLALVRQKQALMLLDQDKFDDALKHIDLGIAAISVGHSGSKDVNPRSFMDPKIYLGLVADKARIYKARATTRPAKARDFALALNENERATAIIDDIRRGYLSEESKLFLQENAVDVYEDAITTCFELYSSTKSEVYIAQAFFYVEKSKASILSEALQSYSMNHITGIPSEVVLREADLSRRIKSMEIVLEEMKEGRDSLENQIFLAKISVDSLQQEIRENYPDYHDLKYSVDVIDLASIKKSLDANTGVFSFFEGDSAWYVCGISNKSSSFHRISKLDLPVQVIFDYLVKVRDPQSSVGELNSASATIYQQLISALLASHDGVGRLIFVVDGVLGYLPFEALAVSISDRGTRYLLEDYVVSYAPSMTLYQKQFVADSPPRESYVGFAPSYSDSADANNTGYRASLAQLPGTRDEVRFAGELFSGNTFLDDYASESNFKNRVQGAGIIHLAMHAIVDDKNPMHSRLIFSEKDSVDDGSLNAYELYNLRLGSHLVVLSACNTGMGEMRKGEGILSLSRAFMYAGCPNVVMSLWKAKDQPTSSIIRNFFLNLKDALPQDVALRKAKLDYLESADPLQAHPANWATFIVVGNHESVHLPSHRGLYTSISALIACISLVVAYLWVVRRRHTR
jgi:CHAT domain-containing protein/tetratricopeptide (TPR) repeat protein